MAALSINGLVLAQSSTASELVLADRKAVGMSEKDVLACRYVLAYAAQRPPTEIQIQ